MHEKLHNPAAVNLAAWQAAEMPGWSPATGLSKVEEHIFSKYYYPGQHVLDVACGAGRTTAALIQKGLSVTGVDISPRLLGEARRRCPTADFFACDFRSYNGPTNGYDHILISFNGIDYAHPETARESLLAGAHRMLRLGGTLVFSSHNIRSLATSPYYITGSNFLFQLRNFPCSVRHRAFLFEPKMGTFTFFASPHYVIRRTQEHGFQFIETFGRHPRQGKVLTTLLAHHVHYVFRKRAEANRNG